MDNLDRLSRALKRMNAQIPVGEAVGDEVGDAVFNY